MNVLYLSPNFPPNYWYFPANLKRAGANVVGIGWEAYDRLRPELKQALSGYCQVVDMGVYDHVYRAAAYLASQWGRFDRVAAQEEHWIDLEAELRRDFNVPGPRPEDIRHFRQKSLMKEVFRKAGIPVAKGLVPKDLEDALSFARAAGYPLIGKPDKGVGAYATYKVTSDFEMREFWLKKPAGVSYILEEFLPGVIQSFDGLTGNDGELVFFTGHQFSTDIMTAVNDDRHLHYWSLRELPADLEELGRRSIAAFGFRDRFFHLEFIRNPQGKLTAMEVNARPPGGLTTDMFNFANDIDVYREWANVLVNGRFEAKWSRPYHVSFIGRKASNRYAHSHEDVIREHGTSILMSTPIDSVFRQAIGDFAYLARARNMDQLRPVVDYIHELSR
ncbi:MAG: ATP-grasp domain-containing protein [Elusimicrobia bacterium]|nr:ATP-grasp domain-containing protein [Elusimicrobiota bacterium]